MKAWLPKWHTLCIICCFLPRTRLIGSFTACSTSQRRMLIVQECPRMMLTISLKLRSHRRGAASNMTCRSRFQQQQDGNSRRALLSMAPLSAVAGLAGSQPAQAEGIPLPTGASLVYCIGLCHRCIRDHQNQAKYAGIASAEYVLKSTQYESRQSM
jgi:hypothetical protein